MDNPQYAAYLSMFELNDREADVIFLGDSITARARYCEFYPETNVLNRGIGSDTSEGVLNRLEEIESHDPRAIFLMIGINDLGYGIPEDTTVKNVEDIIRRLNETLPECTVYLESVLPAAGVKLEGVEELNREYKVTADTYDNCTYVDLYPLFINENDTVREEYISGDGVHLNGAGYQAIIKALDSIVTMY